MAVDSLIHLDRNENRYGPAPACFDVLRRIESELLFAYPRDFQKGHYSQLSSRLSELHGVDEPFVVLGYGCEDILKQALQHFVEPGRSVLLPRLSWWYYRALVDEVGGATAEYSLVETERAYRYDIPEILEMRERARPSALLIASPSNPTGNSITRDELMEVLEAYRGVPVLLDQAYYGFVEDGPDDLGALTKEYPDLLVMRSFSKLHALAGARIGFALAGARMKGLVKVCARSLGFNRISERLALAALDSEEYYDGLRRRMAEDRTMLQAELRAIEGLRVYDSVANFVLVRFPKVVTASLDGELRRRGVLVRFFKEEGLEDCARITLGTREENAKLANALGEIVPSLLAQVL